IVFPENISQSEYFDLLAGNTALNSETVELLLKTCEEITYTFYSKDGE
ncbi:19462_t:CDS:1, partial [Rhizophagus irregularis]